MWIRIGLFTLMRIRMRFRIRFITPMRIQIFYLMRIGIRLFTLMRIRMRIRIRLVTLMRIRIQIFLFAAYPDADPYPTFYPDADPDPDLGFKKGSNQ